MIGSRFVSTGGGAPPVSFESAVINGLAPDGGLYLPEQLPRLSAVTIDQLRHTTFAEAGRLLTPALFGTHELAQHVADALSFETPLVQLDERRYVLELFHGPTLAFKDVGARVLARLLGQFASGDAIDIITATSGDTGGAVANAFHGVSNTRAFILYPRGRVSARQEHQFAFPSENVTAIAVEGSFDDCQRIAKGLLSAGTRAAGSRITSANSINVGRLLPQAIYYAWARQQLPADGPVVFSVPSGNFGNLAAGLIAKRLGIAIDRLHAATNANNALAPYLATGVVPNSPSIPTLSTAMDVGSPSNLARVDHLYAEDRAALARDVSTSSHSDEDTRAAIRDVYERFGYVMDPHTAVGFAGLEAALGRPLSPRDLERIRSQNQLALYHLRTDKMCAPRRRGKFP